MTYYSTSSFNGLFRYQGVDEALLVRPYASYESAVPEKQARLGPCGHTDQMLITVDGPSGPSTET